MLRFRAGVSIVSRCRGLAWAIVMAALGSGCDPYERFGQGDDSLGPVDPVNFPPANLGVQSDGTPGNRKQSGLGEFTAIAAFAGGAPVSYFSYAFPTAALAGEPLRLQEGGVATALDVGDVLAFDPSYKCAAKTGYTYDRRRDEVPYDRQNDIFTALPTASYTPERGPRSSYLPVVREALVTPAAPLPCQGPKSSEALARLTGVPTRDPSGRYLANLVIDPGAAVFPAGQTIETHPGVGLQRWGWFNRYLLAYIDGGVIPTADTTVMEGAPPAPVMIKSMVPQRLYIPRSMVTGPGPMPGMTTAAPGEIGAGYDVLAAARGAAGYSPICEVFTYDAGMALAPEQLPRDATVIEATFNTMAAPLEPASPTYIFCLQGAGQ
jgi:hypothetical protein